MKSTAGTHPSASPSAEIAQPDIEKLTALLGDRTIVLIGMMGAGKSSVGRRLAALLKWKFVDSDHEIEEAAGMPIPEIFATHGEADFRSGEERVIARLLKENRQVLATGGGAFMSQRTREEIAQAGVSVFIKADLDLLFARVSKRSNRPLLQTPDPKGTLDKLIKDRYPTYDLADITVNSADIPQDQMARVIANGLLDNLPQILASKDQK